MLHRNAYKELVTAVTPQFEEVAGAFDETIARQTRLLNEIALKRSSTGIAGHITQPLVAALAAAIGTAAEARGAFIAAHGECAELYRSIGLEVTGTGSGDGCPPPNRFFTEGELSPEPAPRLPLRVVA